MLLTQLTRLTDNAAFSPAAERNDEAAEDSSDLCVPPWLLGSYPSSLRLAEVRMES